MSGNQMPVLTLDVNEEHLKRLEAIFEKYRNGLMIGPAGTPLKIPSNTGPAGGARQTTTGGEANQAPRKPSSPEPVSAASTDGRLRDEKGRFVGSGKTPDSLVSNYKGRGETMFDKYLNGLGKNAQGTLKTYKQINSTLKTTNSRLKSLFKTTVSWGAKIAAIGVAGPFGYGYMASKVAAQYSVAQGLGMETAQMQAARATYSPYFSGTEELVQHLANAQKNPNDPNYAGLVSLGIDPRDGAAKNLPKLMSALASLVKQYKGSGLTQGILNGQGLGFVDVATTNQVEANLDKIPQLNEKFAANTRLLGAYLTPAMQSDYQDTVSNLMVNGNRISNSWYAALARYNPLIRGASDGLTSNIEGFLNGGNFKIILTEAGEGLEKLGKWLNSEQFKNDLDDFSLAVSRIAKAIWSAIKWIGGEDKYLPGTGVGAEQADPVLVAFGDKYLGGALPGANPMTNQYTGEFYKQDDVYKNYRMPNDLKRNIQNFVEQANNTYRLPKNMMSAIAEAESSWNPLAKGSPDENGNYAKGLWQFWDGTAKQYGLVGDDVYDPNKSTLAAGRFLNDLNRRYKGDVAKMLTAYNGGRIDRDGNLSLRMETVKYLIKLLPQIQGALDQHPGIMNQLRNAKDNLQGAGKNARAIIELQVRQSPGSDILAQLAGTQQIPGQKMSLNYFGQAFKLAFEVSPILLVDGIASKIPGGVMPIAVLTEGLSIANGLLHGEIRTRSMAAFTPMAGTTLVQQDICNLNFYNQVTAANATVRKPNRVVMQMIRPASTEDGGYTTKGMTFTALKMALDMHNHYGGCYTVLTPSFIYTRCLMRSFIDTSGFSEQNKQVQHTWQIEFEQPLSSVEQTVKTLASVLDKFDKGMPSDGPLSWSGIKNQVVQEFGIGL